MAAVARQRPDQLRKVYFDGKLGIWPFAEVVLAKRNSKNRARGTPELKPINNVTKEKVRGMILNKIIPAIIERFPRNPPASGRPTLCYIQQDNAGPHINKNDKEFMEVVKGIQDIEIRIDPQPAMSPEIGRAHV